jgi:anti-sigma-K factor RskA
VERIDLNDHEFDELLPAYSLGATTLEENRQVEIHLETCERCQAIVASYQNIAEGLLHAPDPKLPAKALRTRILKQIDDATELPIWRRAIQRIPAVGFGLAVGLIILVMVNIGLLFQAQRLIDQGQGALAQQQAGQTAVAIASYPSSNVALIEEDGVRGTFVYDPGLPVGVVYVWGLQPPPEEQAYQTWLVDSEGNRLSGGLLTFSADPGFGWLMIEAPKPIAEFSSLGVTLEPAGGSAAPTGPRILGTDIVQAP